MSGINNFLPFCPTTGGANLLTQSEYAAATDRSNGNQPGVASSKLNNKAMRQASVIASQIAQFLADNLSVDVLDTDSVEATILAQMKAAFEPLAPVVRPLLSGSGTLNKPYIFRITAGSATVGATYTNNSVTFTVFKTVASGLTLIATGSGAPAAFGTLTKASGTGDATLTFQAVRAPLYQRARGIAGGGGGSGNGAGTGSGMIGGSTTYGTTLIVATGGAGGIQGGTVGVAGGTATLGSGPIGVALSGGGGPCPSQTTNATGTPGASSPFGGGGGGTAQDTGTYGGDNTGAGGGAAGGNGAGGGGGAAGGYFDAIIYNPAASYAYAVGAGGAGGGVGGVNAGGSGVLIVEDHFQ